MAQCHLPSIKATHPDMETPKRVDPMVYLINLIIVRLLIIFGKA